MHDAELLDALETTTLPAAAFGHREHIRVAWYLLSMLPFGAAGDRLTVAIRTFATAHGAATRFHATITWAYLALVNERRLAATATIPAPALADFDAFAHANPDLLDHRAGAFAACYLPDDLAAPLARDTFVLPRRARAAGLDGA